MPEIELPLTGTRVIDLTHYTVGPFCTRILADYGADVIKIEAPEGDPARALPPFYKDVPGIERSGTFLFLNTNKRSVVLDLKSDTGRRQLLALVESADVVVENFAPGTLERLGLGYGELRAKNPRVVLTSISNFGQDGPYRDRPATDITLYGMGGTMITNGDPELAPIRVAGRMAGYQAGMIGALATIMALHASRQRGTGEHVDVSMFEAATHSIEMRLSAMMGYQYTGMFMERTGRGRNAGSGVYPCLDGFFFLTVTQQDLPRFFRLIDHPELLEREDLMQAGAQARPEVVDELDAYIYPWMLERPKAEIRDLCQEFGIMGAPLNTVADMIADRNFVHRKFFQEIHHPETGPLLYPGYHVRIRSGDGGADSMPPRRRAPLLGEHTKEVLGERRRRSRRPTVPSSRRRRPLEGVRILDFGVVLAGNYATMLLTDWGAQVIRVESRQHIAPQTRGPMPYPPRELTQSFKNTFWRYLDNEPGPRPWNRVASFNSHSRGKKSMTVDLTTPEGQEVFERLVRSADGLLENNVPGNIEKLGVTWERVSAINPRFVLVRIPSFGIDGPYRTYRTMGNHMELIAGHPVIRAYPEYGLDLAPIGVPADGASGAMSAFAFMLGLAHRERTGEGLFLEVSTAENMVPMLGEFVMDYSMNGRLWEHMGNDHWWLAPHGAYAAHGEDRWVTIAVRSDEEFGRLCEVMGTPELASDKRFVEMTNRYEHRRELDALIAEWTADREAHWIVGRLLAHGIPSGVVMREDEILNDRQHLDRGFFREIEYSETGRHRYVGPAWKMSESRPARLGPPPMFGEHNEYVYRKVLHYSKAEYQRLEELGHIGMDYA
jgi:crotonobetainyl-CoA:carnitine CoA-transferase CaiB-like acyl-CoA transferase